MKNLQPAAPSRARIVWLDLLKLLAIFMMIANHCVDNVTPLERSEPWYNLWGSLYNTTTRPAIPLFAMVTGALLLPISTGVSTFYKKRLSRLIVPFLIWSLLYNLFPWITGLLGLDASVINFFFVNAEPSQSLGDALHYVALIPFHFSPFAIQMWYVYVLIGLYLYLPFFSAWVGQASQREKQLFLGLWFITLFTPYIRQYLTADLWGTCSWNEYGMLYYFAGFNGYLLLGHYLMTYPVSWSWAKLHRVCIPLFAIGYAVTCYGFKTITATPGQPDTLVELFFLFCSPNVMLMALALFLYAQKLRIESPRLQRLLKSGSVCTLGIWMSHYFFLGPCYALVEGLPIHTLLKMVLSSILLLLVTWAFVAWVLRWKGVGKWIMG